MVRVKLAVSILISYINIHHLFQRSFAFILGRVNGRTSNRAEIRTTNFQIQYLLRFYP